MSNIKSVGAPSIPATTGPDATEQVEETPKSADKDSSDSVQTPQQGTSDSSRNQKLQESHLEGQSKRSLLDDQLAKSSTNAKDVVPTKAPSAQPSGAEAKLSSMSNDDLLKLAESPDGEKKLGEMSSEMKQGGVTPAAQKQLDRIGAATFKPGPGLMLQGKPEDVKTFLHMTRQTMLDSPSFRGKMNGISNDPLPPVTQIEVNRGSQVKEDTTKVGTFSKFRDDKQTIDLDDLEKFPERPPAGDPEGITRGSVLTHEYVEAKQGALSNKSPESREERMKIYDPAHKVAIQAENDYRTDIGQTSKRKMPPHDATIGPDSTIYHFDDGRDVTLKFKGAALQEVTTVKH